METLEHLAGQVTLSEAELAAIAQVTDDDLQEAIEAWRDNPPNERWRDALEAEPM